MEYGVEEFILPSPQARCHLPKSKAIHSLRGEYKQGGWELELIVTVTDLSAIPAGTGDCLGLGAF